MTPTNFQKYRHNKRVEIMSGQNTCSMVRDALREDADLTGATLTYSNRTLYIVLTSHNDGFPGKTLCDFWGVTIDSLAAVCADLSIEQVQLSCGDVVYPSFNPRKYLKVSAVYRPLVKAELS
jgi:hypothetical protein